MTAADLTQDGEILDQALGDLPIPALCYLPVVVEKAGETRQGMGFTHGPFPLVATASHLQTRLVGSGLIGLASMAVVSMGETTPAHKKTKARHRLVRNGLFAAITVQTGWKPSSINSTGSTPC